MIVEDGTYEGADHIGLVSIIDAVCEVFEVTRDELMCASRLRRLAYPRFATYYLGWLHTKRSIANIGRFMGRDHTTILYGRDKCIALRASDDSFAEKLAAAKELAFELEHRKELAAQRELAEVQKALRLEEERERETQRKLEAARQALSKKGVIRGDKIIFPRIDTDGQWGMAALPKGRGKESAA